MNRIFRHSILLPMLMLCCGTTLVGQSRLVHPFEFDEELHDIVFRNANEGYAIGDESLWQTSDAGVTWTKSMPISWRPRFSAIALFGEKGLIIGDATGGLHILTDSETWLSSLPGENHPILEIEAIDGNRWVAVTDVAVLSTIDGGATYRTFKQDNNFGFSAVDITSESLIHVSSNVAVIWRSTDGGATWNQPPQGQGFGEIYDVRFTSADTGFVASWYPWNLYSTTDGGATWSTGPFEYPTSIAIHPNGFGAYAAMGYLRLSDDGGMTWPDSLYVADLLPNAFEIDRKVVTAGSTSIFLLLSYRDVVVESDPGRSIIVRIDRLSDVPTDRPRRPMGTFDLSLKD